MILYARSRTNGEDALEACGFLLEQASRTVKFLANRSLVAYHFDLSGALCYGDY